MVELGRRLVATRLLTVPPSSIGVMRQGTENENTRRATKNENTRCATNCIRNAGVTKLTCRVPWVGGARGWGRQLGNSVPNRK